MYCQRWASKFLLKVRKSQNMQILGSISAIANLKISYVCQSANRKSANFMINPPRDTVDTETLRASQTHQEHHGTLTVTMLGTSETHQELMSTAIEPFTKALVYGSRCLPTTPHWETPSMAVRAILFPVCHHRTAQRLPDWIQTMFGRAVFYSTISIDDIKRLKPENRKDPFKMTWMLWYYSHNTASISDMN
jgi:hypothetical protein